MKTSSTSNRQRASSHSRSGEAASTSKLNKTLTIKEFADAIGVSTTTVSRSITRRGRVSDETREMVLQRMEELGYTPNLNAQRLVSGHTRTVAFCIGHDSAPHSDIFLIGLIRGLQQALQGCGYALLLVGGGDRLKHWVDSRAVDGVIVLGGNDADAETARSVVRPSVPCVVIGTTPLELEPHIGSVFIDLAAGSVKVARALFEYGHRHIGYIGSRYSQRVLPPFRLELERLGAYARPEWDIITGDTLEDGERAMHQLLTLDTPPTAVFARTDELAVGALRAAHKMDIAVPAQISIIGHDDLAFARFVEPPLSTVRIDFDTIGKSVVDLLLNLIAEPHSLFAARGVANELVMRETVGPPPS